MASHVSGARWRKASRSNGAGGACVEVAHLSGVEWRKASSSNGTGGDCVEVAHLPEAVAVRDSKNPGGGFITVPAASFAGLVGMAKDDRLDI
jgi:hypothetical protein